MGRGSVWEGRVRLARREEGADPQRSVTDKQRRQRALPSQTLRAAGLSGLDCVGSGGTDRRRSAPPLTALPNPEFPSRRTPPHFQTGSEGWWGCGAGRRGWGVGLGGVGSGAEVGSGLDDPSHLVEPPGGPFATTGSNVSGAPWCSTDGDRWDLHWQPGGHGGVRFVEGTVRTVHAMSLRGWMRQWLSKGSLLGRFFFQTIGAFLLVMGLEGGWLGLGFAGPSLRALRRLWGGWGFRAVREGVVGSPPRLAPARSRCRLGVGWSLGWRLGWVVGGGFAVSWPGGHSESG
jgi:hypothetical protein